MRPHIGRRLMLGCRTRLDRGQGGRGCITLKARLQRRKLPLDLGIACADLGGVVIIQPHGLLQNEQLLFSPCTGQRFGDLVG
jgi:hypothetical protein